MSDATKYQPDDLLSAAEIAEALGMGTSRVWGFARDHALPRYRVRARGKTTLFRWEDVWRAYNTPVPVPARERDRDGGKVAA